MLSYLSGGFPLLGDLVLCIAAEGQHLVAGQQYLVTRVYDGAVQIGDRVWKLSRFQLIRRQQICWYQRGSKTTWRRGIHHAWSTDFENGDTPYQFPVAVIEDCETHHVQSIYVERVAFTDEAPT